jgi:bifunctional non-homologous end joining protein LigD
LHSNAGNRGSSHPDWIHEIKYDGYRLRLERDGGRVRLITRNGYDWTKRYLWIVEPALKNRVKQFVIDGEAVILGVDGRSDFDALHSGKHNEEVQLYAFDMLAGDGDDTRSLPLSMRKANLARLLARRTEGIFAARFEQGEIGPDLFQKACEFGLEGLVSKRRERPFVPARRPHWVKVKNRAHTAMGRIMRVFNPDRKEHHWDAGSWRGIVASASSCAPIRARKPSFSDVQPIAIGSVLPFLGSAAGKGGRALGRRVLQTCEHAR